MTAAYFVLFLEKLRPSDFGHYEKLFEKEVKIRKQKTYPFKGPTERLSKEEIEYAKIAWKYFENNYNQNTGIVNAVEQRPYFSIADLAGSMMATISAYEIGIIDSANFDQHVRKVIGTLERLPLYDNKLPNKKYNAQTLEFYDIKNEPSKNGIGWSAIDIGRFFVFINKIKLDFPQYFPAFRKIVAKWEINELLIDGYMYGLMIEEDSDEREKFQEGSLGYEEYAAKGLFMSGFDVSQALEYTDFLRYVKLYETEIIVDKREAKTYPPFTYIVSDPYILEGIELGWDNTSKELAYRIFLAQKERYDYTGILTSCGEDAANKAPFYSCNALYADNKVWHCFTPLGFKADDLRTVYTKVAFGWYVLIDDEYSELLFNQVKYLYHPGKGWYTGRYENSSEINKTITAATNGLILEALNYKINGRMIDF